MDGVQSTHWSRGSVGKSKPLFARAHPPAADELGRPPARPPDLRHPLDHRVPVALQSLEAQRWPMGLDRRRSPHGCRSEADASGDDMPFRYFPPVPPGFTGWSVCPLCSILRISYARTVPDSSTSLLETQTLTAYAGALQHIGEVIPSRDTNRLKKKTWVVMSVEERNPRRGCGTRSPSKRGHIGGWRRTSWGRKQRQRR